MLSGNIQSALSRTLSFLWDFRIKLKSTLNSQKNGEKLLITSVKLSNWKKVFTKNGLIRFQLSMHLKSNTTTKQRTSSRIPGNASITHKLTTENAELIDEIEIMDKSDILDCGGPGRDAGVSGLNGSERELTDRSEILFWGDLLRGDNEGNPSGLSLKSKAVSTRNTRRNY